MAKREDTTPSDLKDGKPLASRLRIPPYLPRHVEDYPYKGTRRKGE